MSDFPIPRKRRIENDEEILKVEESGIPQQISASSCEQCKLRKIKCDRKIPSCSSCGRNHVECVYKAKKKPGIRTGFGKQILDRLEKVEQELASQRRFSQTRSKLIPLENGDSLRESLSSNFDPSSAKMDYSENIQTKISRRYLPSFTVLKELIHLYFQRLHAHFPILHPEHTKTRLFSVIESKSSCLLLNSVVAVTLRFAPEFLISSIDKKQYYKYCKESMILKSFSMTDVESLTALVILAYDLVGFSNGPETWGAISLICTSAKRLGLVKGAGDHSDRNSISPQCAEILPLSTTFVEQESRRRLLWGIYLLDRYSSIATSYSFQLNTDEIRIVLPLKQELWTVTDARETEGKKLDMPRTRKIRENTQNVMIDDFGHTIEVVEILSCIHSFLRTPIDVHQISDVLNWQARYCQLGLELENWKKSLPPEVNDETESGNYRSQLTAERVMLISIYYTTVIRLHSSAGYPCLNVGFFSTSPTAAQKCLDAAQNVVALAKNTITFGTWQFLGPHYAWSLWVSSRLLLVDCVIARRPFPRELEFLLHVLKLMGRTWKVAARYCRILTRVIDEELSLRTFDDGSATDHQNDERNQDTITSAQILSDMRQNAYAVDFLLYKSEDTAAQKEVEREEAVFPEDARDTQQISNRVLENQISDDSLVDDVFAWFNWPKPATRLASETAWHSIDGFKDILSRDEEETPGNTQGDWLAGFNRQ